MKIANVSGRLTIVTDNGGIDVETASAGRFGPDPQAVYEHWQAFRAWADHAPSGPATAIDNSQFGALTAPQTAENAGNRTGQAAFRVDF